MLSVKSAFVRGMEADVQCPGGPAGNLKMTMPTAFSVSILAFGFITFPGGYSEQPGLQQKVQNQITWGADYLLKTVRPQGAGYSIVYQVSTTQLKHTERSILSGLLMNLPGKAPERCGRVV